VSSFELVLQARPNHPHCGSFSASRTAKEGSGDAQHVSVCCVDNLIGYGHGMG